MNRQVRAHFANRRLVRTEEGHPPFVETEFIADHGKAESEEQVGTHAVPVDWQSHLNKSNRICELTEF